jgi:hypothetical protein
VQQQQVPLDWGGFDLQPAAPQQPAAPAPPGDDEGDDGEGEDRDWKTLTFTAMTNDRAAA